MNSSTRLSVHTPIDFISILEDSITEAISETEIDITTLKSYHEYRGYEDKIEFIYDMDEAYPQKRDKFRTLLENRGWYYTLCYGTKAEKKWQKVTKNKKLYNRIKKLIDNLLIEAF